MDEGRGEVLELRELCLLPRCATPPAKQRLSLRECMPKSGSCAAAAVAVELLELLELALAPAAACIPAETRRRLLRLLELLELLGARSRFTASEA